MTTENILDVDFVTFCIYEGLRKKWTRYDVQKFLHSYVPDIPFKIIKSATQDKNRHLILKGVIRMIAEDLINEIADRNITLAPIRYRVIFDVNSQKERELGIQSIKQQMLDYIAVFAGMYVWNKRIYKYQCASLPGRGQIYGKKAIESCIRKNDSNTIYAAKGDIKKCYPSINKKILKKFLIRDFSDNSNLLYLLFILINSFKNGISIGSFLSQYLCNYYLSFLYEYIEEKYKKDYTLLLFYMDDLIIIGKSKTKLVHIMLDLINFCAKELGLTIKKDWEVFPIDDGKRRGKPINMMGYVIFRDYTKIRESIFLRARRYYIKTYQEYAQYNKRIPPHLAQKCVSYYGYFLHSNSENIIKNLNIKKCVNMSKAALRYYNKQS